ncbi:hypothetical protein [Brevibacterium spongiae]|uniref:PH domain-containing protein n=1 Tax=Brevibacterium spongiae TaxID=2909672 RepID=A0ABY5SWT0_9MICO|nr:hypothetical protein [Brevibacterium spongiae]UVI37491.1 hypothetical protein L1F31_07545 [Brevibacterium spongiae]
MLEDLSPAAVVRRLDRGQQVTIPSSTRHIIFTLAVALIVGLGLLAAFVWIVTATISDGRSWWLIIVNLRMWAFVIGIIGCLIVAPIGVVMRLRRRESLVLSPTGVALARNGRILPTTLLPWHDIDAVVFERAVSRGPKVLAYILTEEATRRLRGRSLNPRQIVRNGFALSHRRLYPVLKAAHDRFSARPQRR